MSNISLHSIEKRFAIYYKNREYFINILEDYVYGNTDYQITSTTMKDGSLNVSEKEKTEVLTYFNKNREE